MWYNNASIGYLVNTDRPSRHPATNVTLVHRPLRCSDASKAWPVKGGSGYELDAEALLTLVPAL